MKKLKYLYNKVIAKLFESLIEQHRTDAILGAVDFIAKETRNDIAKKGWKCDSDMVGYEYAEIVERKLRLLSGIAYKRLKNNK